MCGAGKMGIIYVWAEENQELSMLGSGTCRFTIRIWGKKQETQELLTMCEAGKRGFGAGKWEFGAGKIGFNPVTVPVPR